MYNSDEKMPEAGKVIMGVVENQLRDNDPSEVQQTLERLMNGGEGRENALRFIASALSVEIFDAVKNSNPYDKDRYVRNLEKLPDLSFLDE